MSEDTEPALLTESQIDERLRADAPLWVRHGEQIVREFEAESFLAAVALVERIAKLAERAAHHPDILIHRYRHLRLTLSTHSAGGITAADLALAAQIDALLERAARTAPLTAPRRACGVTDRARTASRIAQGSRPDRGRIPCYR